MTRNFIYASILFLNIFTTQAFAERWIIKNPKQMSNITINSYSHFSLKENNYLVLDVNDRSANEFSLAQAFNAEAAFKDVKIVIDKPQEENPAPPTAWHVDALQYKDLNSKYTGQGIVVAVLDTGVDYRHYALEKKMWKNVNEIPDNQIDDDHNGVVDDYNGYNFADNLPDPKDAGSHGTHCAGIIAADRDPASNAQGVAQNVKIMPLKIITMNYTGFLSSAAMAVKYASDNGANVLSNSWRIYSTWEDYMNAKGLKMLEEAISYAGEHGVIFVAAAGNETKDLDVTNLENPIYPLSFGLKNIVGVASTSLQDTDNQEIISDFSNYGIKTIAVAAPGGKIYSTTPYGQWATMSGTSMATPLVAGTIARGLSKGYGAQEAIEALNQTSKKTTYWQQYISHGRIDIKKYLED